jgi:hypothetical protein
MWGDNDLGGNFSLLEGDRAEDRIIVYCSGRSAGACMAGTPIVPIYARQYDKNGNYAEYVETAKADDKFIIARTLELKGNKRNYWIISKAFKPENCDKANCDSIIQSHVIGPLEYSAFETKVSQLKIDLAFDKTR